MHCLEELVQLPECHFPARVGGDRGAVRVSDGEGEHVSGDVAGQVGDVVGAVAAPVPVAGDHDGACRCPKLITKSRAWVSALMSTAS